MTIGQIGSSAFGNKNHTQLGFDYKEFVPTGQLDDIKGNSFHLPFARQERDKEIKRNYPVIPEISGHFHDEEYDNQPLSQINPTISVFTNLYNFNPAHKELSYFHPHETEKLFHNPDSKPRFEQESVYDMRVPNEIEKLKKDNAPEEKTLPQHSFTIKRRVRT
jgi:hypothetical protein